LNHALIAILGIGIGYYAVHFGIRLERTKRELEHKERMRALELGRRLPGLALARQSQHNLKTAAQVDKEPVEDDAYDVVSARG
jgi:hypothetical protein